MKEKEAEPKYAFLHLHDSVYSSGDVEVRVGDGGQTTPLNSGTFHYDQLSGLLLPEGVILGQGLTPVYMMRFREAYRLLRKTSSTTSPEEVGYIIKNIFQDRPRITRASGGESFIPFWSLGSLREISLDTMISPTNVALSEYRDPRTSTETMPVRDLGPYINHALRQHSRNVVLSFSHDQTDGSLVDLLKRVKVISPPLS